MRIMRFKRKGYRVSAPILQYYLVFSLPLKRVVISIHTYKRSRLISARVQIDGPGGEVWASGTDRAKKPEEAIQKALAKAGIEAEVKSVERSLKELVALIGYEDVLIINGDYQ